MPKKIAPALATQTRTQEGNGNSTQIPNSILPRPSGEVKGDLRQLRMETGVSAKDMIEVVRELYPKYDKIMHSKVENGDKYGIQLRPNAMTALVRRFAPERLRTRKPEGRAKPYRIQARLSREIFALLQQVLERTGNTMQDYIETLILNDLKGDTPHDKQREDGSGTHGNAR